MNPDRALVDLNSRGGVDEVAEQVPRFRRLVAVADLLAQIPVRLLAINVNCTSQFIFKATAEDNASRWKKSTPSWMLFSISIRRA